MPTTKFATPSTVLNLVGEQEYWKVVIGKFMRIDQKYGIQTWNIKFLQHIVEILSSL